MMKGQKKTVLITALAITVLFMGIAIGAAGSDEDPLISLSYIENVLMPYIDEVAGGTEQGFAVVEIEAGQSLVAHAGSEIILRSGEGMISIPKSASGGFTDVTKGADITNGDMAEANHLLICPRSDGRGIKAKTKVYLMIRGSYEII